MALLNPTSLQTPAIKKALKEAGLEKKQLREAKDLDSLLEESGLDACSVLKEVGTLLKYAEQEPTRLQAAKIGLQLNRMLTDEDIKAPPVVNIIIQDSEYINLNPILVPR